MNLVDWAENEIKIACKRENPDWDTESFDYGCSIYQSALKAFKSVCEDGHSGFSWGLTTDVLHRLMLNLPLSPITEEDFKENASLFNDSDEYLKECGLKSNIQCPRMTSLFKNEYLDGRIEYSDVDRSYSVNIHDENDTFTGWTNKIIDELFPITLPYYGNTTKYKVYVENFLVNPKNGDFDTTGILYCITPEGKKVKINRYYTEVNGKMTRINKLHYMYLKLKSKFIYKHN